MYSVLVHGISDCYIMQVCATCIRIKRITNMKKLTERIAFPFAKNPCSKIFVLAIKKKITGCLIYCILSNGEVIKYHKFISVVVIELSFRCLNTGPEDRLNRLVWNLLHRRPTPVGLGRDCTSVKFHNSLTSSSTVKSV